MPRDLGKEANLVTPPLLSVTPVHSRHNPYSRLKAHSRGIWFYDQLSGVPTALPFWGFCDHSRPQHSDQGSRHSVWSWGVLAMTTEGKEGPCGKRPGKPRLSTCTGLGTVRVTGLFLTSRVLSASRRWRAMLQAVPLEPWQGLGSNSLRT